jgi:hypothetical protein
MSDQLHVPTAVPLPNRAGDWVGLAVGPDAVEERNVFDLFQEEKPYRLSCPGSLFLSGKKINCKSLKIWKATSWPESASELYRPSDRLLSAKIVPAFSDRGCCVVNTTDPFGRNREPEPLLSLPSSASIVPTRLSGPRSRPTTSGHLVP